MDRNSFDDEEQRRSIDDRHPTPDDLAAYLPWACIQLQMDATILPIKMLQQEYVSASASERVKTKPKNKTKLTHSKLEDISDSEKDENIISIGTKLCMEKTTKLYLFYDSYDRLVHINFDGNHHIPRLIFKVLGLIIGFQPHLSAITIKSGLDKYTLYDLSKVLHVSCITDICLDNCFLKEANYYVLLEKQSCLKNLSLSKCKINDDVLKMIASMLSYPQPASKTLSILNLSSNRITDGGAKYLAEALRSNRQLLYLNLMGNRLTDDGANEILNILVEFPLSIEELCASKARRISYFKEKRDMTFRLFKELKATDFDKRAARRKSIKPVSATSAKKGKGLEIEAYVKTISEATRSVMNLELALMEKAESTAENVLGVFEDPYSSENIISKDRVVYCLGNNTLSYLNLAYNNLSYCSLKKLLEVLKYQKLMDRKPRGLVNLCIEGNYLPENCMELLQIDEILEMGLMALNRRSSFVKKRQPTTKGTPR